MKCPRCQREVNDDNQFCPYCGQRLLKEDEQAIKEVKEFKRKLFVSILNRILNISTFVAILFAIIGIFGPVLELEGSNATYNIGGLSWFSYEGWMMLRDGRISIGPFITTFTLYILTFIFVILISAHGIYKAINALKRRSECSTVPHILALSLVHAIYSSIVSNFYYEYIYRDGSSYATGSSWGEVVYSVAIPLFTIALMVLLIGKAVFTGRSKTIVSQVFAITSSLLLANCISGAFTTLGFQEFNIGEQDLFGTLHYFDLYYGLSAGVATSIFVMFILGVLLIAVAVTLYITTIRNLVKKETINRPLFLILSISSAVIATAMVVDAIVFSVLINFEEGFSNYYFFLNESLLAILGASYLAMGFGIAIFAIGEDKPVNDNIIDQEVIEKDA